MLWLLVDTNFSISLPSFLTDHNFASNLLKVYPPQSLGKASWPSHCGNASCCLLFCLKCWKIYRGGRYMCSSHSNQQFPSSGTDWHKLDSIIKHPVSSSAQIIFRKGPANLQQRYVNTSRYSGLLHSNYFGSLNTHFSYSTIIRVNRQVT